MDPKLVSVISAPAIAFKSQPRPLAQFPPSVWGDNFASLSSNHTELESYTKEVVELKEKVKTMLLASTHDLIENITFINSLCRLGVSYHFEEEIEEQLQRIFVDTNQKLVSCNNNHDYDLYTSALLFRVLRQHGYKMSCEIFNKFKDGDGKFGESIESDVTGMLSLYEAAHVRVHGEDLLEEALAFTKTHMESLVRDHPSHPLAEQLFQALEQPLHKGMPRLHARRYISFYQEDKSRNETLLKFALLDFNRVQLLHRQELASITRWYKELGVGARLSYVRDRPVECYFWKVGVYFEPHHSRARIILTKTLQILSLIDDTYDSYGTFEELQCFTNAIQRWDDNVVEQLPDYMKFLYNTILHFFKELETEMTKEGRSYCVKYAIDDLKELVTHYHIEAKWLNEDYTPSFDEYIKNALVTSGSYMLIVSSLIGMTGSVGKEEVEWIRSKPKCVKGCEAVGRLLNDIRSRKFEQKRRNNVASAVDCYINKYGVSEEDAIEEINKMVEDAWKDMNEACMKPTVVSMNVLMRVVNLARTTDVIYKFNDGYTYSNAKVKEYITSLFIDPIVEK